MPYRTALIHSNENKFHLYARLKMKPLMIKTRYGAPLRGAGLCKIWWAKPSTDEFNLAGVFKWREEGNHKPPINKSMPGRHTGWAYVDTGGFSQYVSWLQVPPIPDVRCINKKIVSRWEAQWTRRANELEKGDRDDLDSDDDEAARKRQKISEADKQFIKDLPNRKTRHLLVNLEELRFGGARYLGLCFERQFVKPLNPSPYIHSH